MMKIIASLGLVTILQGALCSAQSLSASGDSASHSTAPGYTISLTQPGERFTLTSPIQVRMTIANVTNGDILWRAVRSTDKDAWYRGFHFLLLKDGKQVKTTFFDRKISGKQRPRDPNEVASGSTILLPKPPGAMFALTIDLKKLYEITEPGRYTLKVSRIGEDYKTTVHSNTVTFQVVP